MRFRILQLGMAALVLPLIGVICWPGPHGGPQFLGQVLVASFLEHSDDSWPVFALLTVPTIGLLVSSVLPHRWVRVLAECICAVWFLVLFGLLLTRIYPPVWPMVLVSAIPSLGALAAGVWMSCLPRTPVEAGLTTH